MLTTGTSTRAPHLPPPAHTSNATQRDARELGSHAGGGGGGEAGRGGHDHIEVQKRQYMHAAVDLHEVAGRLRRGEPVADDDAKWWVLSLRLH